MSFVLGLLFVLTAAAVMCVLPIVSLVRVTRLLAELNALRARVSLLEEELRLAAVAQPRPATDGERSGLGAREPEQAPTVPFEPVPAVLAPSEPAAAVASAHVNLPPLPSPVQPAAIHTASDVEAAIGGRLLLYAGVVVFVLGIGFFVKYAFEHEWITPTLRVALGAICGLAFIAGGLQLARRGYDTYGNILIGGGLAALYLSAYAAFQFYDLIGRTSASVLLIAITAAAATLADRQRHQGLAIMAVGGGFLTPFLVGGTTDAQLTLFSYVALLIAGTMVLAHRRDWPALHVVSYALTLLTVAAWADIHYRPWKYLRTEAFLTLYCLMFLVILRVSRRSESPLRDVSRFLLWSAPVIYHLASIAILSRHDIALPVYLILFALAGVAWSARTDRAWLRLAVWIAAILPFLGWSDAHGAPRWLLPSTATLGALFLMPLVAQVDRVTRWSATLKGADLVLLHLNALGTFYASWFVLEDLAMSWVPRIGVALALVHAAVARWLYPRPATLGEADARGVGGTELTSSLHALAAAFALVAATVAVEFDGRWVTAAWAAEGAAIMWIGLRVRREWFRFCGAALLGVAALRWMALSAAETPADFRLIWNESFALGGWIIALVYALAWWHAREPALPAESHGPSVAALLIGASILTTVLLTTQNGSYWEVRGATMADATFAEQLTLSVLWALYAGTLIAVGIRQRYAPIRYMAIALIGLTTTKVFLVDLSGLEGIYRVLGLLAVGAILLIVSFLYQRTRAASAVPPEPAVSGEATSPTQT